MMSKMSFTLAGAAVFVSGLALRETPAAAQNSVSEIIVFGTDPCPRSTDDQVVVCARKPESERYRIPEVLRSTGSPQARQAWANKAKVLETVGATGINSCSPVGPGGFTGCLTRVIREARTERREQAEDYNPER
jgi:hypothetical protein